MEAREGIPAEDQRLVYAGVSLEDDALVRRRRVREGWAGVEQPTQLQTFSVFCTCLLE